jgi:HSP20 family protein
MDEKDIEVLVDNDVLTIRGEKKSETEDKDRRFSERYYGRFERSLALPFEVDHPEIGDREGYGEADRHQCGERHQALN